MDQPARRRRQVIITADDFGSSSSVNRAVAMAHDSGVLTAASLMAGGEGFQEAVEIALERPALSVGLHLTFCDGRPALSPERLPDLISADGRFPPGPALAGLRYSFRSALSGRRIGAQVEAEVEAQFQKLEDAGLEPRHVDGHHHLHLHPLLFDALCRRAAARGIRWVRLPREEILRGLGGGPAAVGAALFSSSAFRLLRGRNLKAASGAGLRAADRVYGLLRTGSLGPRRLASLLGRLGGSINEVFLHPDRGSARGRTELEALLSPEVKEALQASELELTSFQALDEASLSAMGRQA